MRPLNRWDKAFAMPYGQQVRRWGCGWRALFDIQLHLSEALVILRTKHAWTVSSLQPLSHLQVVLSAHYSASATHPGSLWGKDVGCSRLSFILMIFCSWHSYPPILDYETWWCLRLFLIRKMGREMTGQDTEEYSFLFVCVGLNSFFFITLPTLRAACTLTKASVLSDWI